MTSVPQDVRSAIKLPPLATYQKGKTFHETEDIRSTFEKISKLHELLPDPLRDILCSFIGEEDIRESYEFPKLGKILKVKKLPSEIYITTAPNHVPFWKRNMSNTMSEEARDYHLRKKKLKGILMSAVIARWMKRSRLPTLNETSATEELLIFGPIESVTTLGQQSALIIYENIISACRAISAFPADIPGTNLQCYWYHKFMSRNKKFKQLRKKLLLNLKLN